MTEQQIVVFSLGDEEFAVAISMVREIVRMQPIRVGLAKGNRRHIVILDMVRIFSNEEQAELRKIG